MIFLSTIGHLCHTSRAEALGEQIVEGVFLNLTVCIQQIYFKITAAEFPHDLTANTAGCSSSGGLPCPSAYHGNGTKNPFALADSLENGASLGADCG